MIFSYFAINYTKYEKCDSLLLYQILLDCYLNVILQWVILSFCFLMIGLCLIIIKDFGSLSSQRYQWVNPAGDVAVQRCYSTQTHTDYHYQCRIQYVVKDLFCVFTWMYFLLFQLIDLHQIALLYVLLWFVNYRFYHVCEYHFTGTETIAQMSQCQSNNHIEYRLKYDTELQNTDYECVTQYIKTKSGVYFAR